MLMRPQPLSAKEATERRASFFTRSTYRSRVGRLRKSERNRSSPRPRCSPALRPRYLNAVQHLSLPALALLVGDLYQRAGLGLTPGEDHRALADDLGDHSDVQATVWDLWATELLLIGQDLGEPGGWYDFDFSEAVPVE